MSRIAKPHNIFNADSSRKKFDTKFWAKMELDQIWSGDRDGVVFVDDFLGCAGAAESSTVFAWTGGTGNVGPIRWKAHGTASTTIKALKLAGDDEIGVLSLDIDADDDECYLAPDAAYGGPFCKISDTAGDNQRCAIEWRFRKTEILDSQGSMMCGLREVTDAATLDIPNAGATVKVAEFVGWRQVTGDGPGLDAVHIDAAEVVVKEAAAGRAAQTMAAATWVNAGVYFDGEKVYWYINGQPVNENTGVLPSATNFPDAEPLMPYFGGRVDAVVDAHLDIDWVCFAAWKK